MEDIVYLIGGGPSLSTVNLNLLMDKDIATTNNAYKLFKKTVLSHFSDFVWWTWHYENPKFKDHVLENYWTCSAPYNGNIGVPYNVEMWRNSGGIEYQHKAGAYGLYMETNRVGGDNAGLQALNVLIKMGYKKIALVGFDMKPTNGHNNWHDEHKRFTNPVRYSQVMIPNWINTKKDIDNLGIQVYNCNRDSALTCFEYRDLETLI